MSRCEDYQLLISRMTDEDLSPSEERELRAHIETCPDCAALYQAFSMLSGCLSEDLEESPFDLRDNVMAEIRREEIRRRNRLPKALRVVLSTAACAAVILGVYLGTNLSKGDHLNVAAYESFAVKGAVAPAAEQKAAVTEEVIAMEEPSEERAEADSMPVKAAPVPSQAGEEIRTSVAERVMAGGSLMAEAAQANNSLPEPFVETEEATADAPAPVSNAPAEAPEATPAPALAAPFLSAAPTAEDAVPREEALPGEEPSEEAAAAEEAVDQAAEAAEEPDLEEWELQSWDLSLLRSLLRGSPSEFSPEELQDALFGRILVHNARESWTVPLYELDGSLFYLDPAEETVYRSELTAEQLRSFLGA